MLAVITGGPCVGKTTLVKSLRQSGYQVVDEAAAQLITEGTFLPWVDRDLFQKELLLRQYQLEAAVPADGSPVFFDRGIFDACAYYLVEGKAVPDFLLSTGSARYDVAFLLEPLPFWENDGVRFEDLSFTQKITPLLADVYSARGIPVIKVPVMTPDERLSFVLETAARF